MRSTAPLPSRAIYKRFGDDSHVIMVLSSGWTVPAAPVSSCPWLVHARLPPGSGPVDWDKAFTTIGGGMIENRKKIRFFRRHIPEFACIPGCHDCCGPIMATPIEIAALPQLSDQARDSALKRWDCPHLTVNGCGAYDERPLICRLFGTTPRLACPHGRQPPEMIDPAIELQIELFFSKSRRVLA